MPDDLSQHFAWRDDDEGGAATSETFDPHVLATVNDDTVSVEMGSAMLIVDNHFDIEGGKRLAVAMLQALMELGDRARALAFSNEVARYFRDGDAVANTQEKE